MVYPYILRHATLPTGYVFLHFCDKCALRFGAELLKWLQAGRDEDRFIETRRASVCDRCENVFIRPVDSPNIQLDSTEDDTVRRGLWMAYELCPDCVNEAERMIDGFIGEAK